MKVVGEAVDRESALERYVVKNSIAHDLVPAIERIAGGKRYFSPEIDGLATSKKRPDRETGSKLTSPEISFPTGSSSG